MTAARTPLGTRGTFRRHVDTGLSDDARETEAVRSALALIPGWWRQRAEATGLSGEWTDWRRALPEPPIPVPATGPAPLVDDPWMLGGAYSDALHPRTRNRHGRHYTPRTLAETLWAEVRRTLGTPRPGRIVDPAAGAGALLLPALRQHVAGAAEAAHPRRVLEDTAITFHGTDLDPVAAWVGNSLLAAELLPLWAQVPARQRRPLPRLVDVGDGLAAIEDRPAVVLLNPPYGRVRLDAQARSRWRSLWGHANLYQLFLEAAIERVAGGGAVGAVVPTSWTGGAYYRELRRYIAEVAPLDRVTWVADRSDVFSDVLQETCLAIFAKGSRQRPVRVSRQMVNGTVRHESLGPAGLPADRGRGWLLPRTKPDVRLVQAAARLPHRLADYGWRASTGPLVWNRHKAQIHRSPAASRTRIVWASDLDTGVVSPDRRRDAQRWIEVAPGQRSVMVLAEPAVLVQRTTAPEQPRRLVVAVLDQATLDRWGGEVVVENHVNVLRCRESRTGLGAELLGRLLRTAVIDRLYRSLSGSVAVSAYELGALPLPPPETVSRWHDVPSDELEHAVAAAYGVA